MRNLVLTRQWQGRIELEPGECMHSFCVDPDTGSVFAATSAGAVCRLAADLRVTQYQQAVSAGVCKSTSLDLQFIRLAGRLASGSQQRRGAQPRFVPGRYHLPSRLGFLAAAPVCMQRPKQAIRHRRAGHAVVTLAYAVELESVCIGTADGALVLVSADGAAVEQVGSVEGGVAAAAWSPGGDALLVVTGHGVLLLMNQASTIA